MSKATRKIKGDALFERHPTNLCSTQAGLKLLRIKLTLGHQERPVLLQERRGVFNQDGQ